MTRGFDRRSFINFALAAPLFEHPSRHAMFSSQSQSNTTYTLTVTDSSGNQKGTVSIEDEINIDELGGYLSFSTVGDTRDDNDKGIIDNVRFGSGEVIENWETRELSDYTRTNNGGGEFEITNSPTANGSRALMLFSGCCGDTITSNETRLSITDGARVDADIRNLTDNSDTFAHKTRLLIGTDESGNGGITVELINPGSQRDEGAKITTPNSEGRIDFLPDLETFYTFTIKIEESESAEEGPTATFDFSPTAPTTEDTITLDASESSDPDGTIQSYEWDIGNNGDIDLTGETVQTTIGEVGEIPVSLRVIDNDGNSETKIKTISVDPSFRKLSEEKKSLAGRIDQASLGTNDLGLTIEALDFLENNKSEGDISAETAREAVRRLKLGENITETVIVSSGPADVISPENERNLVGESRSETYDLTSRFADFFGGLIGTISVLAGKLQAAAAGGSSALSIAVNQGISALNSGLRAIGAGSSAVGQIIDDDTIERFGEELQTGTARDAIDSTILGDVKKRLRELARNFLEEGTKSSIEPVLQRFINKTSGQRDASNKDNKPGYAGTTQAARLSSERSIEKATEIVKNTASTVEAVDLFQKVIDLAAGVAGLIAALSFTSLVGAPAGAIAGTVGAGLTLVSVTLVVGQLSIIWRAFGDLLEVHGRGINEVLNGVEVRFA